ncbi:MAG TPA: hypothetical protein VK656_06060, partial [Candidatus Acidoferrum sp.]|nr:hypothetical protein [Candidatus Acidoferrum sp.]
AWFALPVVAGPIVVGALGLAGFSASDEHVTVTAAPPIELAALHADRIHLTANKATFQGVTMSSIDLTLDDVALLDRTAGAVSGTLTGVRMAPQNGPVVTIASVSLSGTGTDIEAILALSPADVNAVASGAIRAALGGTPSKVTLAAPDKATVVVNGVTVSGRLVVDAAGTLAFRPSKIVGGFQGQVELMAPGPAVPFHISTVTVTPTTVILTGVVDPALFGGTPAASTAP